MKLAIHYVVGALWMLVSPEAGFCASLTDTERVIVKRDVEIFPAILAGAMDTGLDFMDRVGKGFAVRGGSKTDLDAIGLHDEKTFETGMGEAIIPQEREKRSAGGCGKKNETASANGSNNAVNTRNASNPNAETLARRKRSAQSNVTPNQNGVSASNGQSPNDAPPNGPPPNGPPPNGQPPNGPPPDGPPPNGPPPNGPPPNGQPPNGQPPNGPSPNGQESSQLEASNTSVREKRSPCRNATAARSKRSAQRPNDDFPPRSEQNEGRESNQNQDNNNRNGQNMQNDNRNPNGANQNGQERGRRFARRKRSAQSNTTPNPNAVSTSNGQSPNGPPPNGPPPNGPPPNGPPPNGPPPNGPPPNGPPPNGQPSNGPPQNKQESSQIEASNTSVREKRSPCRNATAARTKRSAQRPNDDLPPRSEQNEGSNQQGRESNQNQNNRNGQNMQNENPNHRLKKRSAKPCNGNGQPNGAPTNTLPSQQLPQQQQQQAQTASGTNIGDLQRDQNQRTRRDVNDPDKVVPTGSGYDKNLFERVVEVAKELVARITKWTNDMDKEQTVVDSKTPSEKPK